MQLKDGGGAKGVVRSLPPIFQKFLNLEFYLEPKILKYIHFYSKTPGGVNIS